MVSRCFHLTPCFTSVLYVTVVRCQRVHPESCCRFVQVSQSAKNLLHPRSTVITMFPNSNPSEIERALFNRRGFVSGKSDETVDQFYREVAKSVDRKTRKVQAFQESHLQTFGSLGDNSEEYEVHVQNWVMHSAVPVCPRCASVYHCYLKSNSAINPRLPPTCDTCKQEKYWIPQFEDFPNELRGIFTEVRHALRPVELHQGDIEKGWSLGYRHTTRPSRLSWSDTDVVTKIQNLDQDHRTQAMRAHIFLMQHGSSSYAHYERKHTDPHHDSGVTVDCSRQPWSAHCGPIYAVGQSGVRDRIRQSMQHMCPTRKHPQRSLGHLCLITQQHLI